jgi:hypothetical protein
LGYFQISGVEKLVLQSLSSVIDEHIPQLTKDRKTLTSLLLDYDAAKSRLVTTFSGSAY